jgi:hypothetical protein
MSASEDGSSIWNKVAAAASTLTDSVSKAWQAQVATHEGEEGMYTLKYARVKTEIVEQEMAEAPPGQESHLTQAMRAYHLEKAKDPSDLPEWLFSEQERRPVRSRFAARRLKGDIDTKKMFVRRQRRNHLGLQGCEISTQRQRHLLDHFRQLDGRMVVKTGVEEEEQPRKRRTG